MIHDFSVPYHKRIGAKGEPGFRIPEKKRYLTLDLLPPHHDGIIEPLGQGLNHLLKEFTDLVEATVSRIIRNENRLFGEVLHYRIEAFPESLDMVLNDGFS